MHLGIFQSLTYLCSILLQLELHQLDTILISVLDLPHFGVLDLHNFCYQIESLEIRDALIPNRDKVTRDAIELEVYEREKQEMLEKETILSFLYLPCVAYYWTV